MTKLNRKHEIEKQLYDIVCKYFYGCSSVEDYKKIMDKLPDTERKKIEKLRLELKNSC